MAQPIDRIHYYTPTEYLALEDAAAYKSEYYDGEVFAMARASNNHIRIVDNFNTELNLAFRKKDCESFTSEMKVESKRKEFYTYPDIVIVCGEIKYAEGRSDIITNPTAVVEVLSASTRKYDRGDKFTLYKAFESLQCYILLEQKYVNIEVRQKQVDGNWTTEIYEDINGILQLPMLGFETEISNIYNKVEFKRQPRHPRIKKQEVTAHGSTD